MTHRTPPVSPVDTDHSPRTAIVAGGGAGLGDDDLKEMSLRLAHSIRNPLATIKSAVQLVKQLELGPDRAARYLESVVHEVDRISGTLSLMEEYVRLSPREPQSVSVLHVAGSVIADIDIVTGPVSLRCDETTSVAVDPGHLRQALLDLLGNAARLAPAGSTIEVGAERRTDGTVGIWVQDAGPGVPRESAERILRPFYSTSTTGVGLGLNRVHRICRMAGGHLEWCNVASGGCRFTMVLPGA